MTIINSKQAAILLAVSPSTLRRYRRSGKIEGDCRWLKEDVHYIVHSPTVVNYIKEPLEHWALHGHTPVHNAWLKAQAILDRGKPQRSA